jgi:hypothetical protein
MDERRILDEGFSIIEKKIEEMKKSNDYSFYGRGWKLLPNGDIIDSVDGKIGWINRNNHD